MAGGLYSLCTNAPGFIDPCQWGPTPQIVSLRQKEALAGQDIVLKAGITLKLQLQDASALLVKPTADRRTPNVLAGVWSSENKPLTVGKAAATFTLPQFHAFRPKNPEVLGTDYELLVPPDLDLRFFITSNDLLIGDEKGITLVNNQGSENFVQPSAASTSKSFIYTIVGAK